MAALEPLTVYSLFTAVYGFIYTVVLDTEIHRTSFCPPIQRLFFPPFVFYVLPEVRKSTAVHTLSEKLKAEVDT